MIARHLCVHDKYRSFFPKEEQCVTTYYKSSPGAKVLSEGVDLVHYVVLELVPDEIADKVKTVEV